VDDRFPELDPAIAHFYEVAAEERRLEQGVARTCEAEPSLVGISGHLLAVARKPA
jgi:hypothetical protein